MMDVADNAVAGGQSWPQQISPLLAAALDSPKFGSLVFDSDLRLLHATSRVQSLLDCEPGLLLPGSDLKALVDSVPSLDHPSRCHLETALLQALSDEVAENRQWKLTTIDGSRTVAVETRHIGGPFWLATFEDITSRCQSESHLLNLAMQDPLTGLANRLRFKESLCAALDGRPDACASILLIDLDRFKSVNDTLGHPIGDAVLRLVAQRLRSVVRESDVIARLGGDEFAVLISHPVSKAELSDLASRVVDLLQRTYLVGGQVANIGASVGVAVAPKDGPSPESLLKAADLALYEAKSSGRNSFLFFDPCLEQKAQSRRQMELELRKALPLRQLELHYKPQIDISTRILLGFEANVRWRHPTLGLKEWSEFAEIADDLRLTGQIGDWMLRTACREAALWTENLGISIRASAAQFENTRIVESVRRALTASGLSASQLEIAITESILLQNEQSVLSTLHDLRAQGVRVAMEGFGTGYASLRQLASFPFDRVNITRSLLADRFANERHRAIVRAIAALGASLGISTMADGIETASDLARIRSYGCDSVQGYLPGEAVPAEAIPELIAGFSESPNVHLVDELAV
jgi:diguanylate cyclase (GGDEF)-like protein